MEKKSEQNVSKNFKAKKETKEEKIFQAKTFHFTFYTVDQEDTNWWLTKGRELYDNVTGVLVSMEENTDHTKGKHIHICVQLSTRRKLTTNVVKKHFSHASPNIKPKLDTKGITNCLKYICKSVGKEALLYGQFFSGAKPLISDPETLQFLYFAEDGGDRQLVQFYKMMSENAHIEDYTSWLAGQDTVIGRYLNQRPGLIQALHRREIEFRLEHMKNTKKGIKIRGFTQNENKLREEYLKYLNKFKSIFEKNKVPGSKIRLEKDYDQYVDHDIQAISDILSIIKIALKYGSERPHKMLNLYIWSQKPSFGKTRLLKKLERHCPAMRLPNDRFFTVYRNGHFWFLISDEARKFLETKTFDQLKLLMEGETAELDRKLKSKLIKSDNPLIIMATNVSFNDIMNKHFKEEYLEDVMRARILEVEIKSRATLHFIVDRCFVD